METDTTYNGWHNRATWNVALWLGNDEGFYTEAVAFAKSKLGIGKTLPQTKQELVEQFCRNLFGDMTPDGDRLDDVKWHEITKVFYEMAGNKETNDEIAADFLANKAERRHGMKTLQSFIKENGITALTQRIMNWDDGLMPGDMRHWNVTLIRGARKMQVQFSQGSAHTAMPTIEDVLDCLALDSQGIDSDPSSRAFKARALEDWASDYGYDPDSRMAEKVYETCKKQAKELKSLLASPGRSSFNAYKELLEEVERL